MFQRDEQIEKYIELLKRDELSIKELNYEQLVKVLEYLEKYKEYLLKRVGDN